MNVLQASQNRTRRWFTAAACLIGLMWGTPAEGGDWPMWRYGPDRGAASPDGLPAELHLQWFIELPPAQTAWPADQEKLQFDVAPEPVAADGRMFVPSTIWDSLTAYDTKSGEELWRFYTNGPVRFAPCATHGKVLVASDDGFLYCLSAATGELVWKFRGGPSDRRVIGNHRLISMWPARGAPVVKDGRVYFAAGVWPFMGIFLHSLEVETGEVVWTNSGSGSNYLVQPHGSPAFAGVSPQGYLAANETMLIVPGGRGVPAGYDRATGEFRFCDVGGYGKRSGGYDVMVGNHWLANRGIFCSSEDGTLAGKADFAVKSQRHILQLASSTLTALPADPTPKVSESRDRRGRTTTRRTFDLQPLWKAKVPGDLQRVVIQAGDRIYGTDGRDRIFAINLPQGKGDEAKITWQGRITGTVWNMLAADDRLLVVSREGTIFCFGGDEQNVALPEPKATTANSPLADGSLALIPRGASWKYLDDGKPQDQWQTPEFDDSDWKAGPAQLGYGDGDEATKIGFGDNAKKKHITCWFRHTFELADPQGLASAALAANVDDGAVIYLNGEEVARLNMPHGKVDHTTTASQVAKENTFVKLPFEVEQLRPGKNVFAVEVHQRSGNSSDVSFDLELTAKKKPEPKTKEENVDPLNFTFPKVILSKEAASGGYVTVYGVDQNDVIEEFARQPATHVVVLEPNLQKANDARRRWQDADLLGTHIAVLSGDNLTASLPPYVNSFIVGSLDPRFDMIDRGDTNLQKVYRTLRPYGGTLQVETSDRDGDQVALVKSSKNLPGAEVNVNLSIATLTRTGALPNSAPWTHHNADVGNSLIAKDSLVKLPLGLLWFGGPSNQEVLPRHGHGPTPQVVGGRLFIEGRDMLRAVDVYTGRQLWQRDLPNLGQFYDNTAHHPGASAIGGNYVSTTDGVYVAYGQKALLLSPATGETIKEFTLPKDAHGNTPYWGYIGVYEDLLIAGSSPIVAVTPSNGVNQKEIQSPYAEGSARLVVLDRKSGEVKWTRDANYNFRHNAIVAGGGKIFCIDRLTALRLATLKRRGQTPEGEPQLLALNANTGEMEWSSDENVFGTWLAYSSEHQLLVQATSKFRDRARDEEDSGLAVYDAATGELKWQTDAGYGGPVLLRDEMIITQGTAFDLLTGLPAERKNPITGQPERWSFSRNYGCNTVIGCTNLLTFRSAAAGYFDLAGDGGTGNLGGFRSSCTSNLVPADGVLNAPDYTRTCSCSYQLQSSLALVHMPEAEMWTFQSMAWNGDAVRQIGVNFGAPGDRRGPSGTLWIDYPSVGGRSPDVPIEVDGDNVTFVRSHASQIGGVTLPWVASSGVRGARQIEITLASDANVKPGKYTVRLVFSPESHNRKDQPAIVNVDLQGQRVLSNFAIPTANGETSNEHVRDFTDIAAEKTIKIQLSPGEENQGQALLGGIEIVRVDS